MQSLTIKRRTHQTDAKRAEKRFNVLVWHRRAGKTLHLVLRQLERAIRSRDPKWQAAYIAPTRLQAAQIAEPYFLQFSAALGAAYNRSEMRLTLPTGQIFRMFSGEQYDRMRGLYLNDVVIDEAAHVPSVAWSQVISPAISDKLGGVTFAGTPNGRMNMLYEMLEHARTTDEPDWHHSVLTWQDTGAVEVREVERNRRMMTEEEFAQEWECSFSGALRGAYYAKDMAKAEAEGRVTSVRYEASLPVSVALDLGWSDAMVCIYFQVAGTETRILRCDTFFGTSLTDMVQAWRELPFPLDLVILPHDAKVTDLGTGKTRQETLHELGCTSVIVPNQKIHEGIAAVRLMLPNVWFDTENTKMLREAMVSYRSEFDEVMRVHRMTPLHDWSSHYADAMRYLALGRQSKHVGGWGERPQFGGGVYA